MVLQVLSGNSTVQLPDCGSRLVVYKNILTNRHTKMTPKHMEQYIVVVIKK